VVDGRSSIGSLREGLRIFQHRIWTRSFITSSNSTTKMREFLTPTLNRIDVTTGHGPGEQPVSAFVVTKGSNLLAFGPSCSRKMR